MSHFSHIKQCLQGRNLVNLTYCTEWGISGCQFKSVWRWCQYPLSTRRRISLNFDENSLTPWPQLCQLTTKQRSATCPSRSVINRGNNCFTDLKHCVEAYDVPHWRRRRRRRSCGRNATARTVGLGSTDLHVDTMEAANYVEKKKRLREDWIHELMEETVRWEIWHSAVRQAPKKDWKRSLQTTYESQQQQLNL